jgi:peptidoglycan/xylan/chitin deacetylase (PgdA/CDA1 family)
MWALREFYQLKEENLLLKNNRLILISKIKENNLEIRDLKKKLISFNSPGEATLVKQPVESKNPRIQIPDTYLENGIPLTFNNGSTDKKLVSLTFDGGSEATAAIDILDTLRSRNIKATMFITGQFIQKYPDIVKKIAQDGHELGNHTYKHPHLTSYAQDRTQTTRPEIDADFLSRQLIDAEKLLINRCDLKFSSLWRAPFGEYNRTICRWALQQGYIHVGWRGGQTWLQNLDSNDWIADKETPGYKTPAEVMDKILRMAETNPYGINGGIILMHLGTARKERTQQVHLILGTLIDSLHDRGYEIIPVTELIKRSDINIGNITAKKEELAATLF